MFNSKRSRATYEADLHDSAAVHVAFGTPLPSLDADTRDDGSYIPLHKQEVRDDKGRRRLHGAFTGGWSAGYFNTVGSKEGWTPSTFVSSRTARRKDDPRAPDQRPEDYMDDEDLADAAATKEIRTTDPFGALGAPSPDQRLSGGLASLMRIQGDTIGLKLLRKMGWKDGQGIGPRIRRLARLDISGGNTPHVAEKTHMFAPENINMVSFIQKSDQKGLGFNDDDDARISRISSSGSAWAHHTASGNHRNEVTRAGNGIYEGEDDGPASGLNVLLGISEKRKSKHGQRGGLGVGVLNDTGSEEDDPYEMGPRISYNRVLGGEKTKKKKKLAATTAPAYAPTSSVISGDEPASSSFDQALTDTKRGLTQDKKGAAASKDDTEPPPAYSEGPSPLQSFTFLMATAGGASSIITQVQQGGPPINAIGDVGADETISMDLRGTRFVLSRDELLTLPEFVLLSLFPNGLFPEGHMGGFAEGDAVQVDYDPASLQYMLDFFRTVAQSIPAETSPSVSQEENASAADAMESRDDSSKRAGIIVLREDLDFYVIPPRADITQSEMLEVKRAAGKALLQQNGIFSGLKRSDEPGTTEAHLIEMLTAG
ncbi:hypothetical protein K4K56_003447 [Colletotrichum sp. SAR 10_98]|nr:hypothetical protein K4K56_003447 [Colletotrichum sp. SAR 10_98]